MILRQSANAAVHVLGGILVGALLAGVAALAADRQRRMRADDEHVSPPPDA